MRDEDVKIVMFETLRDERLHDMKGSKRHTAELFNSPEALRKAGFDIKEVFWPLRRDAYSEYGSAEVLKKLFRSDEFDGLISALEAFWPSPSQHWDAVAQARDGTVLLFEAKAHVSELDSSPMDKKTKETTELRLNSLKETAEYFGAKYTEDGWTGKKYQTANRLAFAYFLNKKLRIPARVEYLIFLNDTKITDGRIETQEDFECKFREADNILGFANTPSLGLESQEDCIGKRYIDVNALYGTH